MLSEELLRQGFSRAPIVAFLGMTLEEAEEGKAVVLLPFKEELQQGLGVLHGGVLSLLADSACWFAAESVREDSLVTTVELKINFVRPAKETSLKATARVAHSGKRIVTARFEVHGEGEELLALGSSTLVTIDGEHEGMPTPRSGPL